VTGAGLIVGIMFSEENFDTSLLRTNLYRAVFTPRFQSQHPQRFRHNHPFLPVIWWRNTLEQFEALKSSHTTGCLVWNHATNCSVEDFGWGAVMEGTGFLRINNMSFMEEIVVAELSE
jgi:hypothetical protein